MVVNEPWYEDYGDIKIFSVRIRLGIHKGWLVPALETGKILFINNSRVLTALTFSLTFDNCPKPILDFNP